MKRLCLLAITILMLSGCAAPKKDDVNFGVVMYEPATQVLTYRYKNGTFPNVKFCALSDQEIAESFRGFSVTKDNAIVYAFNRLKLAPHPDTWVKLQPQKDVMNRWPHTYTFDINGDGGADVFFMDKKRDGKCDLLEIGPEEKT